VGVGGRRCVVEEFLQRGGCREFVGFAALGWEFDGLLSGVEVYVGEALCFAEAQAVASGDFEPDGEPSGRGAREGF